MERVLCRVGRRAGLALAFALVILATSAVAAYAGVVTLSNVHPAPGTTVTHMSPNLSVHATSTATIPYSQTMTVDGLPLTTGGYYLETGGHWENDGCDEIWVPDSWDFRDLTMTAMAGYLSDGLHTAQVGVTDSEGGSASQSWSFTVAQAPTISTYGVSPSVYSTNTTPVIKVPFYDNGGTHTCQLTVGGVVIPTTQVGNEFVGQVTTPLVDGAVVNASARVTDQGGLSTTYSWNFTVFSVNQLSAVMHPANGSIVGQNPSASCTVSSAVTITSVSWTTDNGTPVNSYSVQKLDATHYRAQLYPGPLADGSHTTTATAYIAGGGSKSFSTSYVVNQAPSLYSMSPSSGTRTMQTTPTISVNFSDNLPANRTVQMTLDGQPVPHTLGANSISYKPPTPLGQEQTHTVYVRIQDAAGNVATASWSFWIDRYAAMPTTNCLTCHSAYPAAHEVRSCDPVCHRNSDHGDGACDGCHYMDHDFSACTGCHAYQATSSHESADGTPHNSTTAFGECRECHSPSLTREHQRYKTAGGTTLDCNTCHSATAAANVKAAIAAGDTRCETCHGSTDHRAAHASPTTSQCFGVGCHPASKNLIDVHSMYAGPGSEHSQFEDECALCHENPRINTATAGTSCTPACHSGFTHSQYNTMHAPTAASDECRECHTTDLSTIHGASPYATAQCDTCHASADNWSKTADCAGCHPGESHITVHDSTLDSGCLDCHAANLVAEHLERGGLTCDSCHAVSAAAVGAQGAISFNLASFGIGLASADQGAIDDAIASGDTSCGACHDTSVHPMVDASWSRTTPYYRWGTRGQGGDGPTLSSIGDNPIKPGVHGNYTANTAKCGICHSVHRANADGVKLLDTSVATCAGCHQAGATTVTNVVVSWEAGGPHGSGTSGDCNSRGCHVDNPHGANGSMYGAFSSKLLTSAADAVVSSAAAQPASSGVTASILDGTAADAGAVSAVRTGYTCNIPTCHGQTMLTVLQKGWSEDRQDDYLEGNPPTNVVPKTGHPTVGASNAHSFAAVSDCESCHDQTDGATRSGFTFPHSQTARGASNTSVRSYLWMTLTDRLGGTVSAMTTTNDKPKDGACLKCHRLDAAIGVGTTF